jgi:hypothetical protein
MGEWKHATAYLNSILNGEFLASVSGHFIISKIDRVIYHIGGWSAFRSGIDVLEKAYIFIYKLLLLGIEIRVLKIPASS